MAYTKEEKKGYDKRRYQQQKEKIKERNRNYQKLHGKEIAQKRKGYINKWQRTNIDKMREYHKTQKSRFPHKHKARDYAHNNKQRGIKCMICGSIEDLHFHHTNYEKNEGITMCEVCHHKIHKEGLKCEENLIQILK